MRFRVSLFQKNVGFFGARLGATTAQPTHNWVSCQYTTNPVGPAS
jgi:hypothetical protein